MTLPSLPAQGNTNWYSWASALHARANNAGTLNVKDFGAVGDGTTNDTAAIQAALNAVPGAGATVFFPAGAYLVPSGGLTCANPVRILGTSGSYYSGVGSSLKVTADNVIGLTLSGQASHVSNFGVFHPTTGTRSGGLIGIKFTVSVFNRVENCHFSGFYTNMLIDNGYEWSISNTVFEDSQGIGLDIRNTGAPDSGDCSVTGCAFFHNSAPATPVGDAVVWRSSGGLRFLNNKINGGFADGLRLIPDDGVATSVLLVANNSFENYAGRGVSINPAATTGQFNNSVLITGNEFTPFNTTAGVGVQVNIPVMGVTVTGNHIYHANVGIDLEQVRHAVVEGNALNDVRTTGIRIRSAARDVAVARQPIDMQAGGVAVQFDDPLFTADSTFETNMAFAFSDTVSHDLFEFAMNDFNTAIVDIDMVGVNAGVGMWVRRLSRALTAGANGTDDTTVAVIGTDFTSGTATVSVNSVGLKGPVRVAVTKAAGTAVTGQVQIRVRGVKSIKQLVRNP